jgi:hypothetical protein
VYACEHNTVAETGKPLESRTFSWGGTGPRPLLQRRLCAFGANFGKMYYFGVITNVNNHRFKSDASHFAFFNLASFRNTKYCAVNQVIQQNYSVYLFCSPTAN